MFTCLMFWQSMPLIYISECIQLFSFVLPKRMAKRFAKRIYIIRDKGLSRKNIYIFSEKNETESGFPI